MKNWKRQLSGIVATVMIVMSFGCFTVVTAAGAENPLAENEINLLRYLDILLDSEAAVEFDRVITRGELAHIAVRTANMEIPKADEKLFYDVPLTHPYCGDIHALASAGIVAGDGNGYYRPGDEVSDLEACKIFSALLGYKNLGEYESYLWIANRISLNDGVAMDGVITYGDALQISYNTLHTEMFERITYGDGEDYKQTKGYFAIERYHDLIKMEGLVSGIPGTTLTRSDDLLEEGQLLIDGRIYQWGDTGLFGQYVVFYTRRNNVDGMPAKEIEFIYANTEKNNVLTLQSDTIEGITERNLNYYQGNNKKSVRMSDTIDVIYNGVAYPDYQEIDFKPAAGQVTLIDHTKDGIYDVALIDSYQYVVVKAVDLNDEIVYGKYPASSFGGEEVGAQKINMVISHPRGPINLSYLKEGDVLAIRESKNTTGTKRIRGELVIETTSGIVTTMMLGQKVVVEGKEIQLSGSTQIDRGPNAGELVTVYIHQGKAAAILHPESESYKFGYLIGARNKAGGLSFKLEVKIVDTNESVNVYEGVTKLKIDESTYTKDAILGRLMEAAGKRVISNEVSAERIAAIETIRRERPYAQPIRYRLNDEGKLTHLDTIIYDSTLEEENSLRILGDGDVSTIQNLQYTISNRSLYTSGNRNMVASIPNFDNVIVSPLTDLDDGDGYQQSLVTWDYYPVEVYTVDKDSMVARYVLAYDESVSTISSITPAQIVSDISYVLDDEGYVVKQVTLLGSNGQQKTYPVSHKLKDYPMEIGDVVRVSMDLSNTIAKVETWYSVSDGVPSQKVYSAGIASDNHDFYYECRLSYGTILSIKDGFITHTNSVKEDIGSVANMTGLHNYFVTGETSYYVYDSQEKDKLSMGSAGSVTPYSVNPQTDQKAMMFTQNGNLYFVYIIK